MYDYPALSEELKDEERGCLYFPQGCKQLTSHLVRHSALAWLPCKRKPRMTEASIQACQWNPETFPKISQPWQSNWLSISSNPSHRQPKLCEFGCEIIVVWRSQRSRKIKAKNTRWEQSKPCLNTKGFVQAKLQTTQEMAGKKQRSLSFPDSWGLELWLGMLQECWVISRMLFTSWQEERNNLCYPSRMWVCSRVWVCMGRWNFLAAVMQ